MSTSKVGSYIGSYICCTPFVKKFYLEKGRFVHWVVHMLYTIRKKVLLGKKFYLESQWLMR